MLLHIYFGDNNFEKLSSTALSNHKHLKNELAFGLVFNQVCVNGDCFEIDDVYASWSYVLFLVGGKLWHCGLKGSKSCNEVSMIVDSSSGDSLRSISCGWNTVALVTQSGKCIILSTNDFSPIPTNEITNLKVKDACVGETNVLMLSEDHNVYFIDNINSSTCILPILSNHHIVEICCGNEHSLLLSKDGCIYSFGTGSRGQLGHGDTNSQSKPLIIEALDGIPIKSIAAGGWHSAAISVFGDLYTWGWNESGQLGFPCSQRTDDTPYEEIEVVCCLPKLVNLQPDVPVKVVSCGSRHSVALSECSHVWTWGFNSYEQLGFLKCPWVDVPTLIALPSQFVPKDVKCNFWSIVISGTFNSTEQA